MKIDHFKYKWEVLPCGVGEKCWCRMLSIVTDEEIDSEGDIRLARRNIKENKAVCLMKSKNPNILLDRDTFREGVFCRDGYKCVICGETSNLDAHHILERRLWSSGGYHIDNGATLCSKHHILAEQTVLSCEEIREAAKITKVVLPEHFYEDVTYSKWGDIITSGGARRIKGELFEDESVQKILAQGNVLNLYTRYVRYPRTYHLPYSQGMSEDDRMMPSTKHLEGKNVVVQAKLDGENTTFYNDYMHARSLDSKSDVTRHWIQNLHSKICHDIPDGWRLSIENLYAKHTIKYVNSSWAKDRDFAILFRVWDDKNFALSWKETKEWGQLLGLKTSPVLYEGIYDESIIRNLYKDTYDGDELEGFVVWNADRFHYKDYRHFVGKYVTQSFKQRLSENHGLRILEKNG